MPRASSRSSSGSRGSGGMFSSSSRSSAPARAAPAARAAAPAAPVHHAAAPAAPPPAPVHHAPPPAIAAAPAPSMMSGLGSTIMQGMAFGAGSEVAHRAVGSLFGGSAPKEAAPAAAPPAAAAAAPFEAASGVSYASHGAADCGTFQRDFARCVQDNKNDISMCQMYMDNFSQCQRDAKLL